MDLKQQAAEKALEYVRDGMCVGLGSGSTVRFFTLGLGRLLQAGKLSDICGVPTSRATAALARDMGIPLVSLAEVPEIDLAVDGADEIDPDLNLIKGLGRALLREKIVEIHARQLVIVADENKLTSRLGALGPLPVELAQFEVQAHVRWLNTLGCRAELWLEADGAPVLTDNGNYLARCWFPGGISDPDGLARQLADRPGILEHGMFLHMAHCAIVAGSQMVRILERVV